MKDKKTKIKVLFKLALIVFLIGSVGYLIAKEYAGTQKAPDKEIPAVATSAMSDGVIVYYFYGNQRCSTCRAIESYAYEALAPLINEKKISWSTIKVDEPENRHFIYDFNISSSGPVVVEYKGNKVVRSKSLDKVWQLVRDKTAFLNYVREEIAHFTQEDDDKDAVSVIEVDSAKELIEGKKPVILDIRTEREFKTSHISGAINIPVEDIEKRYSSLGDKKDITILIYCNTQNKSWYAARFLKAKGYNNLIIMNGGIQVWLGAGYPTVKE